MAAKQSSTTFADASKRVYEALSKLEISLRQQFVEEDRKERDQQRLTLVVNENRELQDEQQRLNQAIDELQTQYDDLHKVAVNIYGRLDDSVRRITKIIGN